MDKKILLKQLLEYFKVKDIPDSLPEMRKIYKEVVSNRKDKEIPDNILLLEDKYLRLELLNKKLIDGEKFNCINTNLDGKFIHGDQIALLQNDIINVYGDVLINPVNKDFAYGDNLLFHSGMRLRKKCLDILDGKELNPTEILITRAFNLLSDYIVHVVLPETTDLDEYKKELQMCYFNVLECSNNNIAKTIVLRDICNNKEVTNSKELLIDSINNYLDQKNCHLEKVIIVASSDEEFDDYVQILDNYKETTE